MTPNPNPPPAQPPVAAAAASNAAAQMQQTLQAILAVLSQPKPQPPPPPPQRADFLRGAQRALRATGNPSANQFAGMIDGMRNWLAGIDEMKRSLFGKTKRRRKRKQKAPRRRTSAPRVIPNPPTAGNAARSAPMGPPLTGPVSWSGNNRGLPRPPAPPPLSPRAQQWLNPPIIAPGTPAASTAMPAPTTTSGIPSTTLGAVGPLAPSSGGGGIDVNNAAQQAIQILMRLETLLQKLAQDEDPNGRAGFAEHESDRDPSETARNGNTSSNSAHVPLSGATSPSSASNQGNRTEKGLFDKAEDFITNNLVKLIGMVL